MSRKHNLPDSVYICSSVDEALILMQEKELKQKIENVFVIGGGQIYKKAINLPECEKIYLTEVDSDIACDTFFPEIPPAYQKIVFYFISNSIFRKNRKHLKKTTSNSASPSTRACLSPSSLPTEPLYTYPRLSLLS